MTRQKVTDPALLSQLGQSPRQKVTDPNLIAQLNSNNDTEDEGAYLDSLPESQEYFNLPKNALIGLTHLGRNLHNLPHDIASGFDVVGSSIGRMFGAPEFKNKNSDIASYLPYDPQSYADVFGQKGEGSILDNLVQKGIEHAPELYGAGGLIKGGIRRLKGTHHLDEVKKLINEKEISNFNYPHKMIKDAEKFLPKTEASKELIKQAKSGNYEAAFKLQSQIGHHQRKLLKSPLASENSIMAPKAGELKQQMLSHLEKVLRGANHIEEAEMMRKGIKNYAQYMKIKNAALPVMKKLGIPVTILSALGFGAKKLSNALKD